MLGWNICLLCGIANYVPSYALQWIVVLPLEIIAGALTVQYWNTSISPSVFVSIFLVSIVVINLTGIRGYGEAEFLFAIIKIVAIVGFM
jgi:amino acid transporter